jgi:hypothetical protein
MSLIQHLKESHIFNNMYGTAAAKGEEKLNTTVYSQPIQINSGGAHIAGYHHNYINVAKLYNFPLPFCISKEM